MDVKRTGIVLKPTNSRVVIRPFEIPNEARVERIIARVASLSEAEVAAQLDGVMRDFRERHQRTREFFLGRNDLGQELYDPATGGCCDGLQEDRINRNQGAESTLAFLLSLAEMNLLESSLAAFRQAR